MGYWRDDTIYGTVLHWFILSTQDFSNAHFYKFTTSVYDVVEAHATELNRMGMLLSNHEARG